MWYVLLCLWPLRTIMQVGALRTLFVNSISPNGLAGDRKGDVPASAFSLSAQKVWETIKEDRDLDLPTHKVISFASFSISFLIYVN